MLKKYKLAAAILAAVLIVTTTFSYAQVTEQSGGADAAAETAAAQTSAQAGTDGENNQIKQQEQTNQTNAAAEGVSRVCPRSSYMCFVGMSAAMSAHMSSRSFASKCISLSAIMLLQKEKAQKKTESEAQQNGQTSQTAQPVSTEEPKQPAAAVFPDPSKPMIALTFDDGPYSPVTDRILAKLEEYGGHATFFVVGNRIKTYSSSVQRAVAAGCQIGNHTYDHKNQLTKLSVDAIKDQIHQTDIAAAYYAGAAPVLVRPVGGALNDTVKAAVGKPLINWSVDTLDWKSRNAESVKSRVLGHVSDGDIVLMHDLYPSTADACDTIIPELVKSGYQLVTVSELAAARGITLENGTLYTKMAKQ